MTRNIHRMEAQRVFSESKCCTDQKCKHKLEARIEAALALHKLDSDNYCMECADPPKGACDTVKILRGEK